MKWIGIAATLKSLAEWFLKKEAEKKAKRIDAEETWARMQEHKVNLYNAELHDRIQYGLPTPNPPTKHITIHPKKGIMK